MGQVRMLDQRMNEAGYLRLMTVDSLAQNMSNSLPQELRAGQTITKKGPDRVHWPENWPVFRLCGACFWICMTGFSGFIIDFHSSRKAPMPPELSIVIPTHKRADLLKLLLDSILEQGISLYSF